MDQFSRQRDGYSRDAGRNWQRAPSADAPGQSQHQHRGQQFPHGHPPAPSGIYDYPQGANAQQQQPMQRRRHDSRRSPHDQGSGEAFFWVTESDPHAAPDMPPPKHYMKLGDTVASCRDKPDTAFVWIGPGESDWIPGRQFLAQRNIPIEYGVRDRPGGPPPPHEEPPPGTMGADWDMRQQRPGPMQRMDAGRMGRVPTPMVRQEPPGPMGGYPPRGRPMYTGWGGAAEMPGGYEYSQPPPMRGDAGGLPPPQHIPMGPQLGQGRGMLPHGPMDGGQPPPPQQQQFQAQQGMEPLPPGFAPGHEQPPPPQQMWHHEFRPGHPIPPAQPPPGAYPPPMAPPHPMGHDAAAPAPPPPQQQQQQQPLASSLAPPAPPPHAPAAPPAPPPSQPPPPDVPPPPPTQPPPPSAPLPPEGDPPEQQHQQQPPQPRQKEASAPPPWVNSDWTGLPQDPVEAKEGVAAPAALATAAAAPATGAAAAAAEAEAAKAVEEESPQETSRNNKREEPQPEPLTEKTVESLEALERRVEALKESWSIKVAKWSMDWQLDNFAAVNSLLGCPAMWPREEGWAVQPFEWEHKYLSGASENGSSATLGLSQEQSERWFGDRGVKFCSIPILQPLPTPPLTETMAEAPWAPEPPLWTPGADPRLSEDPEAAKEAPRKPAYLPVPAFAFPQRIRSAQQPFNPAGALHAPPPTEASKQVAAAAESPLDSSAAAAASGSRADRTAAGGGRKQARGQRPNKLEDPEKGQWCYFDSSGREYGDVSMAGLRELLTSMGVPEGCSIYRKADGIWLPFVKEPMPSDALEWKPVDPETCGNVSNGRLSDKDIVEWFEREAQAAVSAAALREQEQQQHQQQQQQQEVQEEEPSAAAPSKEGQSQPSSGAEPPSTANDGAAAAGREAEEWFDGVSLDDVKSRQDAEAFAYMKGIRLAVAPPKPRRATGPPPPPQFCAMLRAEMHKKVVLGEAGRLLIMQLLQETMEGMQELQPPPAPAPTPAPRLFPSASQRTPEIKREASDLSAKATQRVVPNGAAASEASATLKRKQPPEAKAAAPAPRPSKPSMSFFGPTEQSRLERPQGRREDDHQGKGREDGKKREHGGQGGPKASGKAQGHGSDGSKPLKRLKPLGDHGDHGSDSKASKDKDKKVTPEQVDRAINFVIEKLAKYDKAELEECFARPVVEVFPELKHDYLAKIDRPIALSGISKRLKRHEYRRADGWELFQQDVELMISNCKVFNNHQGQYFDMAMDMGRFFDSLCHKYSPYDGWKSVRS